MGNFWFASGWGPERGRWEREPWPGEEAAAASTRLCSVAKRLNTLIEYSVSLYIACNWSKSRSCLRYGSWKGESEFLISDWERRGLGTGGPEAAGEVAGDEGERSARRQL